MQSLVTRRPDDWHLHLRDGAMLEGILPHSSANFARALIMPNLVRPVIRSVDAAAYRNRIVAALPIGHSFEPFMTLYLTEATDPTDVEAGFRDGLVCAVKLYPAGATTNSDSGVREIERVMPVLERMAKIGLPLCVHGEVTDPAVDIFDREAVFIERLLLPLRERLPELRIVMEHITTKDGVDFVASQTKNTAATITTHHLIINRNTVLAGGIRPHYYCLPIVKRESHRLSLRAAATSGDRRFFLGTDSAPHADPTKECACGCAGIFTAINTISCVAEVFEQEGALDRLEGFIAINGAAFYGRSPNEERITLIRDAEPLKFPTKIETGAGMVTVFDPQMPLRWRTKRADIAT
ncbi:dihydroorotase [Mesorhizobium sp. WSM4887]|uniref:dihydroorotase n=1 Tax=Mesorhizobium sp. WSM4887 TaxID=3038543 RepID=UPI002415F673|nr:dihydroorotase [Mesorhizobium sp. WSM4887]MDG4889737.1 dihydroorotase [Mesorhizobium sp. WSM4887]